MKQIVIEAAKELAQKWAQSTKGKEKVKMVVIDFLKDEETCGYFQLDEFTSTLTKEDWKEIAKAVGEDVCVNCGKVSVKGAIAPDDFYPQWFKA